MNATGGMIEKTLFIGIAAAVVPELVGVFDETALTQDRGDLLTVLPGFRAHEGMSLVQLAGPIAPPCRFVMVHCRSPQDQRSRSQ